VSFFRKDKSRIDGLRSQCKDCKNLAERTWNAKNPIKKSAQSKRYAVKAKLRDAPAWCRANKRRRLSCVYGITIELYDRMVIGQKGLCRICGKPETLSGKSLAVDHCHKTGVIRGLLCAKCNKALGLLGEDPRRLRLAASYLEVPRYAPAN